MITAHGVSKGGYPNGFAICTNAGYLAVYGLNAIGPVKSMARSAKVNVRTAMSSVGFVYRTSELCPEPGSATSSLRLPAARPWSASFH